MILPSGNYYIIKSYRDGRNLGVDSNGVIHVRTTLENISEQWIIEKDPVVKDGYYFYNCYTNKVLQCDGNFRGVTINTNRLGWELMIVEDVIPYTTLF